MKFFIWTIAALVFFICLTAYAGLTVAQEKNPDRSVDADTDPDIDRDAPETMEMDTDTDGSTGGLEDEEKQPRATIQQNMLLISMFLFALILLVPFLSGAREAYFPEDDKPLRIDMDYIKDPFFGERQFRAMLMKNIDPETQGAQQIKLNRPEWVMVLHGNREFIAGSIQDKILYVRGDMESKEESTFLKEVMVTGSTELGARSVIRCLSSDGDIELGPGAEVVRWISTRGNIRAAEGSYLGNRATALGNLEIGGGSGFHSLYAFPVTTPAENGEVESANSSETTAPVIKEEPIRLKKAFSIEPRSTVEKNIEYKRDVVIGEESIIKGNITCRGKVIIKKKVLIEGNIFAEEGVKIEEDCMVAGSIHSLGPVWIEKNFEMGCSGSNRSLIVRGNTKIGEGSLIKGSIKVNGEAEISDNIIVEGSVFGEKDLTLGKGCIIRDNLFTQGKIRIGSGTVIGRRGVVKSVVAKKGIELDRNIKVYGLVMTDGPGRVK